MHPQSTHSERLESDRQRRDSLLTARPTPVEITGFCNRYTDLRDRRLADVLTREDAAEEREELSALERISCHVHRRWAHGCISSPIHVIAVTGHRWCRQCEAEATVAIDELTGDVSVTCTRCHKSPDTPATQQILRTCRASLAAASENRRANDTEGSQRPAYLRNSGAKWRTR
ncbi:hypothetical protein [Saccharopolyspora tripterygii]